MSFLTTQFAEYFSDTAQSRGRSYYKNEYVNPCTLEPSFFVGLVHGSTEYYTVVILTKHKNKCAVDCSCPHFTSGNLCKHIWACFLYIEADDENNFRTCKHLVRHHENQRDHHPSSTPSRKKTWQLILKDIKDENSHVSPLIDSNRSPSKRKRAVFGLQYDVFDKDQLGIILLQQEQTKKGWGKIRPLSIRPDSISSFPNSEDHDLLNLLAGGPQLFKEDYFGDYRLAEMEQIRVNYATCNSILPALCKSNRLINMKDIFDIDKDNLESHTYTWDEGDAWQFKLKSQRKNKKNFVSGVFFRGEDELRIDETDFLFKDGILLSKRKISKHNVDGELQWFQTLQEHGAITVPEGSESKFMKTLPSTGNVPILDLPPHWDWQQKVGSPEAVLSFDIEQGINSKDMINGTLNFKYDHESIPCYSKSVSIIDHRHRIISMRDRKEEKSLQSSLRDTASHISSVRMNEHGLTLEFGDLQNLALALNDAGWGELVAHIDQKKIRPIGAFDGIVSQSGMNWFELSGSCKWEDKVMQLPDILKKVDDESNLVKLSDGSFGLISLELIEKFSHLQGLVNKKTSSIKLSTPQMLVIESLINEKEEIRYDQHFKDLKHKLYNLNGIPKVRQPRNLKGKLRSYQKEGLGWLSFIEDVGINGCLADDMGLGKTVQVLSMILRKKNALKKGSPSKPSLVIMPKSLLGNWTRESHKFTPNLKVAEYAGPKRKSLLEDIRNLDLVFTTYATARIDVAELMNVDFECIILDEAQAIKNPKSGIAKCVNSLNSHSRLAMTGTPVENSLNDLWSIFEFLNPGMLGKQNVFANLGKKSQEEKHLEPLKKALRPFLLRRTKEKVLKDLPEKSESTIYCTMEPKQRKVYEEVKKYYAANFESTITKDNFKNSKIQFLEALLRLRQIACHPALVNDKYSETPSIKQKVLLDKLIEVSSEGHKSLVFSQYTSMLKHIKEGLKDSGLTFEYLDGSSRDREGIIDRFQNNRDINVFLISLKAGGVGLNLTSAEYCFIFDPWWNPAVESQAIDRIYRIGQKNKVFAYKLIAKDTIEEKIALLQSQKKQLAEDVISSDSGILKTMTYDDMKMLLS